MNTSIENPYVGPRTFLEKDRDLFFGRDREARDLLALVVSEPLVLFYAQSGAGKSSLVNTRLIPDLRKRGFQTLTGRVSGDAPAGIEPENIFVFNLLQSLTPRETDPAALALGRLKDFLAGVFKNDSETSQPHALIIDQFEEIFRTHHEAWEKRADFFSQLAEAMETNPYLWVVLIMREDFIASLDPYIQLLPGRLRMRYYMQRLERAAALDAIKKPVMNLRPFEEGVAEKLVDDLRGVKIYRPDGTPEIQPGQYVEPVQLQVVCANLWENLKLKSPSDTITGQDLLEVGDVDTSLGNYYADRVKAVAESQSVHERKIREWFGRELISSGGVRTPVLREQNGTSGGLEDRVVQALHDLVRAEQRGGAIFYELTHDRLVEPILANNKKWEEVHFSPLQRQASLWDTQGQDEKWLLSDHALIEVELWARENPGDVTEIDEAFLRASRKYQAKLDAERETHRRELEMSQKLADEQARSALRARRSNRIYIIMGVIAVIAAISAFLGQRQAKEAEERANELAKTAQDLATDARSSELTTFALDRLDNQLDLAILLGLEADSLHSSTQSRRALLTILQEAGRFDKSLTFDQNIASIKFRSDGKSFILVDEEGFSIWDTDGNRIGDSVSKETGSLYSVEFNPQGSTFATLEKEGVFFWDFDGTALGGPFLGPPAPIFSTAFSPDGSILTASGKDGSVLMWDFTSGDLLTEPLTEHTAWINSVSFNPRGDVLVSASDDNTFILWDMSDPRNPGEVISQSDPLTSCVANAIFSPDGKTLVTGQCGNGILTLWDVSNPEEIREKGFLDHHQDGVYSLKFSPVGNILASGSQDGTIALWDFSNPDEASLLGTAGEPFIEPYRIYSIDISPDGRILASGHSDGSVLFWDISNPEAPSQIGELLQEHDGQINSVAFSPDGQTLATGSFDGTIILWDVATRQPLVRLLSAGFSPVNSVTFHPDGTVLAASTETGYIRLWDVSNRENPIKVESKMVGVGTFPSHMEYSQEGKFLTLFSTIPTEFSAEETSIILDAINYQPADTGQIMFEDPQGSFAVFQIRDAAEGDQIRLIDVLKNETLGRSIPGTYLAIAPDAGILAYKTVGEDTQSIINLWDLETGLPIEGTREGEFLALSPDGSTLAYQSIDEQGEPVIVFWDHPNAVELNSIPVGAISGGPFVSEKGNMLAYKTFDDLDGASIINLIDVDTGDLATTPIRTSENRDINMLSADGRILIYTGYDASGNQTVGALDAFTGVNIGSPKSGYINRFLDVDPLFAYETYDYLTGENQIQLIDPSSRQLIVSLSGTYLDTLQDGELLVYDDNGVNFYDLKNRKRIREPINGTYLGITPDGKTLATLSGNNTIIFWNLEKTWPIGEPLGEKTGPPASVVLSPDGNTLAWVGVEGLSLQDTQSGTLLNEPFIDHFSSMVPGEDTVFSPDGRTVAVTNSSTYTTTVWDLQTQEQVGEEFPGVYVTFSLDGQRMAIGNFNTNTTTILDLLTQHPVAEDIPGISVSFSSNGRQLAVGNSLTYSTALLDLETGQIREEFPGELPMFIAQGKILAISNNSTFSTTLWNITTNRQIGEEIPGISLAYSPDGQHLGVWDSFNAETTLLDLNRQQIVKKISGDAPKFSPDGKIVSVGNPLTNTTTLWELETQQQIASQIPGVTPFFSSDSQVLAVVDYNVPSVTLWDLTTYEQVGKQITGDTFTLSPDGGVIAAGDYDSYTVSLWDVKTQEPIAEDIPGELYIFSADGGTAVVADYNTGLATIWDLRNQQPTSSEIPGNFFALSPDGGYLAAEDYNLSTVTLWDLKDPHVIGPPRYGTRPLFSPDGKYLSVGNYTSSTVSIWEVVTFQPAIRQSVHPTFMVFSPDSSRLASYAEDGIVVRDLVTQALYRLDTSILVDPILNTMGFSEDGSTLTALDNSGRRYVWDISTGRLLSELDSDQPFMDGFTGLARFSPDGRYLIYESIDALNIWDIKEDKPHPNKITGGRTISFSPDGRLLVAANDVGNIILYEFPQLNVLGLPLDTGLREIYNLGLVMEDTKVKYLITQDGSGNTQIWDWADGTKIGLPMSGSLQYLGSSTQNHAVIYIDTSGRLIKFNWDLIHADWVEFLCPLARRNFSQEEWTTYFPDASWPPARDKLTCPGYPLGS